MILGVIVAILVFPKMAEDTKFEFTGSYLPYIMGILIASPFNAILTAMFSAVLYGLVYITTKPLEAILDSPLGNFIRFIIGPLVLSLFWSFIITSVLIGLISKYSPNGFRL